MPSANSLSNEGPTLLVPECAMLSRLEPQYQKAQEAVSGE